MNVLITENIKIIVETFFQPKHSHPKTDEYFFAYRITIENLSQEPVRLLRRRWFIVNADAGRREVEGEGVVGEQPLINPGKSYQYVSGCGFPQPLGMMFGYYLMQRENDLSAFQVDIPAFTMVAPFRLN